ncbi:hypothetical protein GOP47_0000403 [Adiantum capillus-veneris]|uniref:Uncharacterized protein n=1 Tax=Adiantum capillus-veneris TaxID=13818 RepID=A0A9D4ZQI4_ADICA|nr:hypothetical protein GOP47_0000403 [Adiantum capillus-veneris]
MAESSSQQGTTRQERLLPKLASLAIRHADLLVTTSCLFGLIALLLLPALAKNTYISENALIPGSASPKFTVRDAMDAAQFARDLQALRHNTTNPGMAIRSFLVKYLVGMGVDFYVHPFSPPGPTFSSINFLLSHPSSTKFLQSSAKDNVTVSVEFGVNIAGIIRAPRGDGNEAIVLVTPYDAGSLTDADVVSLGLGLSLFQLLNKAPWLAKDIIWLAADSQFSLHTAVSAWLKDYHEPFYQSSTAGEILFSLVDKPSASLLEESTLGDFKRAGVIGAGVVFNMQGVQVRLLNDFLTVYAEGPNGQMPNLDLINVVNNLAVYREGLQMRVDMAADMLEWAWLHITGQVLEKVGQVAATLNAGWKFGLPAVEYVQGAATLTRSVILQTRREDGSRRLRRYGSIEGTRLSLTFREMISSGLAQCNSCLRHCRPPIDGPSGMLHTVISPSMAPPSYVVEVPYSFCMHEFDTLPSLPARCFSQPSPPMVVMPQPLLSCLPSPEAMIKPSELPSLPLRPITAWPWSSPHILIYLSTCCGLCSPLSALGAPTGAHGAFRDYQIDAVTIEMSFASQAQGGQVGSLLKFGRLLEGTVRSVNNLLEKFHQSFFLYFLTGPSKFVSVGVYTIPLMLLLITLPLKAAALCTSSSSQSSSTTLSQPQAVTALQDGKLANWLFAVFSVCVFELWASVVAIFPPIADHMVESSELKVAVWVAFSTISCFLSWRILVWISRVLGIPNPLGNNWTAIKASTLGIATIGVGIMSSINFAAALVGAVVLAPMCLTVCPLRTGKGIHQFFIGLALSMFCALLFSCFSREQLSDSLGVFWDWVECQWKWGSATYLYLSLVHLPCSVLCILVLMCAPNK